MPKNVANLELRKGSEAEMSELRYRVAASPPPESLSAWGGLGVRDEMPDIFALSPPSRDSPTGALLIAPRNENAVGLIGAFMADFRVGVLWCHLWVAPDFRRKGIGTWALEHFLRYCFGEFRFVKINMLVGGADHAAHSFALSFGFRREAHIAIPASTGRSSEAVFGLMATDFQLRRAGGVIPGVGEAVGCKTVSLHRRRDWPEIQLRQQSASDVAWVLSELTPPTPEEQRNIGAGLVWPESREEQIFAWTFDEFAGPLPVGSLMVDSGVRPVGTVAVTRADPKTRTFWYGLWIAPSARRQGFGGAAIRGILHKLFSEFAYEKAFAGVYAHNHPSIMLHFSMGFVLEGIVRASAFTGGRHWDELIFGMDAERWRGDGHE